MTPCATCTAGCLPAVSGPAPEQPHGPEWTMADGVFIKTMHIPRAGTLVPTHAHQWDHTTLLARGALRVWADGAEVGEFRAPHAFHIPAGVKHAFLSLEDETTAYCVHNTVRTPGEVEVAAEHHLEGV